MKFVADLHLHSHFSRATSKNLNFEHLTRWAQLKGVQVVGTGDIAHPGWLQEMKQKLEPAESGLFRLKDEYARDVQSEVFPACQDTVRFMLAGEISSIYKKNDKVRKIHNVIFAPTLKAVEKIQAALEKIGNIRSDGRPILGLDSRDLLEIILDIDPQNYLIPAHIWTPWFSLLGSKSGFDSVEECFEDLTPHIFALETGLSSDPPMNWRISGLDRYTLVSNSDAHSPQKLAREANLFDTDLSYPAIFTALQSGNPETFLGTVEFFPEEGKYHYDGHRKCGIRWNPKTTLQHSGICSQCGKPVTVGVMHRVETLADREEGQKPAQYNPFQSLIPLPEILAEVHGVGPNSKRVKQSHETLLAALGPELSILRDAALEEIEQKGGTLLAEGIRRMRHGEVTMAAGYDGEYGVVRIFETQERNSFSGQLSLLPTVAEKASPQEKAEPESMPQSFQTASHQPELDADSDEIASRAGKQTALFGQSRLETSGEQADQLTSQHKTGEAGTDILAGLNQAQREAVLCTDAPLIIVAGPGTGKTRTLTHRIAYLIAEKDVFPENILAITFTNKAAEEMAGRLIAILGSEVAKRVVIKTFHAFGTMILREAGQHIGLSPKFSICNDLDRQTVLKRISPNLNAKDVNRYLDRISTAKYQLLEPETPQAEGQFEPEFSAIYRRYETTLRQDGLLDFDDLIGQPIQLFETYPEVLKKYQRRFRWISVDEYQDINFAQYRLLRLLTAAGANLCVIGDPNQAIYGFRGAKREYFLKFQQDFPKAKTLHLNQNYRSTQLILDASGQVMAEGSDSERVNIWSNFIGKTKLEVYEAPSDRAEAEYAVHQIEQMVGGTSYFSLDSGRVTEDDEAAGRSFADFAVLYRLGAQSQPLVEAFQRSGIPYQTSGQSSFYERKEIRQILAHLWFIYNPRSNFHLGNLLSSKKSSSSHEALEQLVTLAEEQNVSLWEILQKFEDLDYFDATLKKQLREVVPFLNNLKKALGVEPVTKLIELIQQFLLKHHPRNLGDNQAEAIEQLRLKAAPFENRLDDFLESVSLQKETDAYDPRADRVTLMTLHASKGLEFPVIFIVGCEENLIPYQQSDKEFDLEEERRLFYVGMTRAQQKLILTQAKTRFLFGQRIANKPSRFLSDIENALMELKKMAPRKTAKEKQDSAQLRLF